jgi:hypothetical protein
VLDYSFFFVRNLVIFVNGNAGQFESKPTAGQISKTNRDCIYNLAHKSQCYQGYQPYSFDSTENCPTRKIPLQISGSFNKTIGKIAIFAIFGFKFCQENIFFTELLIFLTI